MERLYEIDVAFQVGGVAQDENGLRIVFFDQFFIGEMDIAGYRGNRRQQPVASG